MFTNKNLQIFKFSIPSIIIISSLVFIFISDWIQELKIINIPSGLRHLLILFIFIIIYFSYGNKIKLPRKFILLSSFLFIYSIISFFYSIAPFFNLILGFFYTFFFIFIFLLSSNTHISHKSIIKIFQYILIYILLMSIPPFLQATLKGTSLRDNFGLFRELGAFGAALNVAIICSLTLMIIKEKKIFLYLAFLLTFIVFLTILKKSIISSLIIWFFYIFYLTKSYYRIYLIFFIALIFLLFLIFAGNFLFTDIANNQSYLEGSGAEDHVRIGMYLASIKIAFDFFPFGSGFGTFASLSSITNWYSDIYFQYGVAYIGANSPQDVAAQKYTILDTFWPHIIGELGFIGTFLYLSIWFFPLKKYLFIFKNTKSNFLKGISFFSILILIVITWEGFTLYTPEVPVFVFIHSGITGFCFFHLKNINEI